MTTQDKDSIRRMVRAELEANLPSGGQKETNVSPPERPSARIIDIVPREVTSAPAAPIASVIDESIKSVITEDDLRRVPEGSQVRVAPQAIITPSAHDLATQRRITFNRDQRQRPESRRPIAIGADHGGFELKELIKQFLAENGYALNDFGTYGKNAVDYPDFAHSVASAVAGGQYWRGIIIDGAGIGSCMTANKVPGVRAAMCYDQASAQNSRAHNDANVLTLGATLVKDIGEAQIKQLVRTFLETDCTEDRHLARVAKIERIERQYLR